MFNKKNILILELLLFALLLMSCTFSSFSSKEYVNFKNEKTIINKNRNIFDDKISDNYIAGLPLGGGYYSFTNKEYDLQDFRGKAKESDTYYDVIINNNDGGLVPYSFMFGIIVDLPPIIPNLFFPFFGKNNNYCVKNDKKYLNIKIIFSKNNKENKIYGFDYLKKSSIFILKSNNKKIYPIEVINNKILYSGNYNNINYSSVSNYTLIFPVSCKDAINSILVINNVFDENGNKIDIPEESKIEVIKKYTVDYGTMLNLR